MYPSLVELQDAEFVLISLSGVVIFRGISNGMTSKKLSLSSSSPLSEDALTGVAATLSKCPSRTFISLGVSLDK
uniref:Uncharacterized protein n=1 Tax=Babesia bovis TaxID=5865 RepID=S6C8Q4_BABBO|nr:hypothetical protein [Babesia bovis]